MYLRNYFIYFILLKYLIYAQTFKLNKFDSAIGKWKLLYTSNNIFNDNYCELIIRPNIVNNDLYVKIKKYEYNGLITFSKVIDTTVIENNEKSMELTCGEECSMIILNSEKYLKSIGSFHFPYFAIKYKSIMKPKYIILWKVDKLLNRLYIYIDNYTYIFEKNYYDKFSSNEQIITADTFLITNLISFLLGKILESTFHIK